jgi:hypothetical protein
MTTMTKPLFLSLALLGAAPAICAVPEPALQAFFEDDLSQPFAHIQMGMTTAEVLALMKREPARKEISNHLGLEIQRLVWVQWGSGISFHVLLVAGRLASKTVETKPLMG